MDPNCIFCKIIKGEIPGNRVYENGEVYAFLDIHPVNLGHTLIVPKIHTENLYTLEQASLSAVILAAQKVAKALKKAGAEGVNLLMNNDQAAGQLVFHAHLHVIPRYAKDGFRHWRGAEQKAEDVENFANKLRKSLIS